MQCKWCYLCCAPVTLGIWEIVYVVRVMALSHYALGKYCLSSALSHRAMWNCLYCLSYATVTLDHEILFMLFMLWPCHTGPWVSVHVVWVKFRPTWSWEFSFVTLVMPPVHEELFTAETHLEGLHKDVSRTNFGNCSSALSWMKLTNYNNNNNTLADQ